MLGTQTVPDGATLAAVPETKAFYRTSEFWLTVGAEVTALTDSLPTHNPTVRTVLGFVVAAAYAVSRGLAKAGTPPAIPVDSGV